MAGDISFHAPTYWADPDDTEADIEEDLRRYPIGGPTRATYNSNP